MTEPTPLDYAKHLDRCDDGLPHSVRRIMAWPHYSSVLAWLCGLIPLALIVLKVMVVVHEPRPWAAYKLRPDQWTPSEILAAGLARRLDDNSFWICVALWLAAWRIRDATRELRAVSASALLRDRPALSWLQPVALGRAAAVWLILLGPALAVVAGVGACRFYVGNVKPFNGTFSWKPENPSEWTPSQLGIVTVLNYVEGSVFCANLCLGAAVLLIALNTSFRIAVAARADAGPRLAAFRAAKLLAQACLTPFVAGLLFYAVSSFLVDQLHLSERGKSATEFIRAFGTIALYGMPFLVLLLFSRIWWPRQMRIEPVIFNKVLEWFTVEVRDDEPPGDNVA